MAEASPPGPLSPLDVELDPEFEPQSRPRSCTWPLQRPELQASPAKPAGEPPADAASMIPEEEDDDEELHMLKRTQQSPKVDTAVPFKVLHHTRNPKP